MELTTKEKILECARILFNEKGYQAVTMREISNQLNMSVGNLTYHFKKKEDILKELMSQGAPTNPIQITHTLIDLDYCIREMLESIQKYLFFFVSDKIVEANSHLTTLHQTKVNLLHERLLQTIIDLKDCGYFSELLTNNTIQAIVEMIMYAHLSWAKKDSSHIQSFIDMHWELFKPFFTQKAMNEFNRTIKKD